MVAQLPSVSSLLQPPSMADWMWGCLQVALLCAAVLRQQGYAALADFHKLDREELEAHADDLVKAAAFYKPAAGIYAHVAEQAATEEGQVQPLHCAGQQASAHMLHSSLQRMWGRCPHEMHRFIEGCGILAGKHSCPKGAAAKESRAVCLQAAGA